MTSPGQPIATTYVEIRVLPGSKEAVRRGIQDAVSPGMRQVEDGMSRSLGEGARKGRLRTETELAQLDARMVRSQAVAETVGAGVGRVLARGAQLAGGALVGTAAAGFAQLSKTQAAVAQLESAIKSTGGTAGLTQEQMERLAGSVEKYSGQSKEGIVAAQTQLLAFDRVRDSAGAAADVFTRTAKASADMAQRMGGDAASNATLLGRALQDPAKQLGTLAQANITFTAAQAESIKQMAQTGDVLGAQKAILDQVEKTVGGAAAAYGQTLPGALDRARNSFDGFAESSVKFVDDHRTLSTTVAGAAASLYVAVKAVKTYNAIRETLFAGSARRIAANLAEARSVDAIAAAEARAALAGGARGAGGIAGTAGTVARTGLLGRIGAGAGAAAGAAGLAGTAQILAPIIVGAAGIRSIGTVKRSQEMERLQAQLERAGADQRDLAKYDLSVRDRILGYDKDRLKTGQALLRKLEGQQRYTVDTNNVADATTFALRQRAAKSQAAVDAALPSRHTNLDRSAGVFGGTFDTLPSRIAGDPAAAREGLTSARKSVRDAERALAEASAGGRGASRGQIASAEARVLTAQDAVAKRGGNSQAEQLRLEAAEANLSELRGKGGANADKVREAEERLVEARKNAKTAAQELREAEKPKALGATDLLKRLTDQATNAKTLVADADLLISKGVSGSTLKALQAVEKEAPGSFDKLAKTMTPAMAKALNAQHDALTKAHFQFYDAPEEAALRQKIADAKSDKKGLYAQYALENRNAFQRALENGSFDSYTPTLPGPKTTALDPQEHGAPRAPGAVNVTLTGVRAATVRDIATSAVAQADKNSAAMLAGVF